MDPSPLPRSESEPSGWDLIDDYQVGKDTISADAEKTRRIAAALPPAPVPQSEQPQTDAASRAPTTSRMAALAFWRRDGSAAHDAEVMSRILAGKREREEEATAALQRVEQAKQREELERRAWLRERQRREIQAQLELQAQQRRPPADETPLQRALREAADMFLALGICPDHLEYLPELGCFHSWGGVLYDHSQIFSLRDARGHPIYTLGPSPYGAGTICYSQRERRWRLNQPVQPQERLIPIDRLLPIPRRLPDGGLRFSAKRPGVILMDEGEVPVYVLRNAVYTVSQLRAAHHLHSGRSPLLDRLVEQADEAHQRATAAARRSTENLANATSGLGERMVEAVGTATDVITGAIASTTRFFRRR